MAKIESVSANIGGKELSFQTGKLALQADGAAVVTYGDIVILAAASMTKEAREGCDFFPLMVDYDPKFYATGKLKNSRFMKREARPPESAILIARMTDRPLRPLFNKETRNDVQIVGTLLQANGVNSPATTMINAASMACQLGGLPIEAPVGAVRVGMNDSGEFYLDPTFDEIEKGKLDLVLAGTADAILMVEAGANLISDEEMLKALEFGHEEIKKICKLQQDLVSKVKIEKKEAVLAQHNEEAQKLVEKHLTDKDFEVIKGVLKKEIKEKMHEAEDKLLNACADQIEEGVVTKGELMYFFEKRFARIMRTQLFETGKRIDDRKIDEVRPLYCEVGLYPRLHGSALFQRGETQSLSITTVGAPGDHLIVNDPDQNETKKYYMHHYNFPPYSVGEVRPMRGTGRREIGHGMLAERALRYVLPDRIKDNFPYTIRVVSEITTCNGSSSMASVCGSTLTLMDAGVPIKTPISGVAMGLMMNPDGDYRILTDIMSFEDFDGDMDFKVTGDENSITALQLDIKVKGLKMSLLKEALEAAKKARAHILEAMKKAIPEPRKEMSEFAPRVDSMQINPEFIRIVIGKGGETIQRLCADYDVQIDIEDDGLVMISSVNQENGKKARAEIEAMTYEPKTGDVFEGTVKSVMDFGAFVEYLPGKEALVHVSELAKERVDHPSSVVKEGDKVKVKILGTDKMGRTQLSMKQA
ncbi:polyribonucleotide nucleotidyltransferase [Candidatus Gracilibacteria bacterium]|nr:polyribonucleotide nucleotidyltransferase [Candidatus Gracilibacteria bacterium]